MRHTNPHPKNHKIKGKFLGKVSSNGDSIDHYLITKCLDKDSKIAIALYNLDDQKKKELVEAILRRDAQKLVFTLCNSEVGRVIAARTNFTPDDLTTYCEQEVQPGEKITNLEYAFLQKLLPTEPESELANSSAIFSGIARNIPDDILSGLEKFKILKAIAPSLDTYIDKEALDYTPTLPVLTTECDAIESVFPNELHAIQNAADISEAILLTIGALKQAINENPSLKQLESALLAIEMNYAEGNYSEARMRLEKILASPTIPEKTKTECILTLNKAKNLSLEHSDTRRYWENKYAQYYLGMSSECMAAVNIIGKCMVGLEAESFSEVPKLVEIITNIIDSNAYNDSADLKFYTPLFQNKRGQKSKAGITKKEAELEKEFELQAASTPLKREVFLAIHYPNNAAIHVAKLYVYITPANTLAIAFKSQEGEVKRFPLGKNDIDPILFKEIKDYLVTANQAPPTSEKLHSLVRFAHEKKGFPRFYGETILSSHGGISKSTSPSYRTEITEFPIRNRKTDKYSASPDTSTYPHQHPGAPMVSSLSGHTFYIISLMTRYLGKEGYSSESQKNVNLFLKAVAATYVLNGWHSLEEVMDVFKESEVQMYCSARGFNLDANEFDSRAVASACSEAIPYAKTRCLLEALNQELKEAANAGHLNLRHVEEMEKNYRELSDVLKKLETPQTPEEVIAMSDEHSSLPGINS